MSLQNTILFLLFIGVAPATHAATFERTQLVFGDVELRIQIVTRLDKKSAFRQIEKGFEIVRRYDAIFSTFRSDSEIARLNALPKPFYGERVSREMRDVLASGLDLTRRTRGYFDITFEMENPGTRFIRLRRGRKLDVFKYGVRINPTGLVKGYTVDRILMTLRRNKKITSAFVSAGGDMGRFDKSGKDLTVLLHDPSPVRRLATTVNLKNTAVSTSGFYERGRHIRNTRGSTTEYLQTSVTAPDCLISDALATAFMFMPEKSVSATLKLFPGSSAILYKKDGTIKIIK